MVLRCLALVALVGCTTTVRRSTSVSPSIGADVEVTAMVREPRLPSGQRPVPVYRRLGPGGPMWVDRYGERVDDSKIVALETATVDRRRGALEGAGIGLLVGAGLGLALGYAAGDDPECREIEGNGMFDCLLDITTMTAREKAVLAGTLLGLAGLSIGAAVGGSTGHTTREVHVPSVSATIREGGGVASATWRF